jgi:hypothetical protein
MKSAFPSWVNWNDPHVGRHLTCGEVPWRIIAGDSLDEGLFLVIHPREKPMWVDTHNERQWKFVNVLDEIAMRPE